MVSVIPINDERPHERSTACWCDPHVEWADPDTGEIYAIGPKVRHNAADCREAVERLIGESIGPDAKWAVYRD